MVEVPVPPVIENLKLAFCVFMNQDVRIARTLIEEKTQLRTTELGYAESRRGYAQGGPRARSAIVGAKARTRSIA